MTKILYTAEATVTGGRKEGHGRTSDGNLEVDIKIPKELGGDGTGTNPEQLFAVGYASCFESAVQLVARRMKSDAEDVSIESKVNLHPGEDRGFFLSVELDVTLPTVDDPELAENIVRTSHKVCPYSNAIQGNIDVKFTVNGTPLD
jgi:Ohr subfamily peroxiredoxin